MSALLGDMLGDQTCCAGGAALHQRTSAASCKGSLLHLFCACSVCRKQLLTGAVGRTLRHSPSQRLGSSTCSSVSVCIGFVEFSDVMMFVRVRLQVRMTLSASLTGWPRQAAAANRV